MSEQKHLNRLSLLSNFRSLTCWVVFRNVPFAQFLKRLLKLFLCVHYDRSVPSHRLFEWLT